VVAPNRHPEVIAGAALMLNSHECADITGEPADLDGGEL
jgi:hypothetical protein